jgi:hypothetical protein
MEPQESVPASAVRGHEKADDERLKRMEQLWALRRDALQFTKDYGLFTLRSCLALNGGAILAILAFIGNLYGRTQYVPSFKLHDFGYAIAMFGPRWPPDRRRA